MTPPPMGAHEWLGFSLIVLGALASLCMVPAANRLPRITIRRTFDGFMVTLLRSPKCTRGEHVWAGAGADGAWDDARDWSNSPGGLPGAPIPQPSDPPDFLVLGGPCVTRASVFGSANYAAVCTGRATLAARSIYCPAGCEGHPICRACYDFGVARGLMVTERN